MTENTMGTLDRLVPSTNGKHRKAKTTAARKPSGRQCHVAKLQKYAQRYVGVACVLSSGLNAYANVQLCQADDVVSRSAAGLLGAVVPFLVWLLFKTAGHAYRGKRSAMAYAVGAAGTALLLLSVWHCAHAIAALTGGGLVLASLMALGIDYGLVASEVAAIGATQE